MKKTLTAKKTQINGEASTDSPEAKYKRWLEAFGQWISRERLGQELAKEIGISPQGVSRYFVHRTHDCPALVFLKALEWQERNRVPFSHRWSFDSWYPKKEFQTWNFDVAMSPRSASQIRGIDRFTGGAVLP